MVFTVVVTPGTGACVTLTDPPWVERPDSGNWLAVAPCDELVADPGCAYTLRVRPPARSNTAKARPQRRRKEFLGVLIYLDGAFLSTKLLPEAPDAQRYQGKRKKKQCQEIRPECADSAAL